MEENGCPLGPTRKYPNSVDIIEFFEKKAPVVSDEIAVLYFQGMSISDIAAQTGLKRHAIWKAIKQLKKESDAELAVPYDRWRKGKQRTGARPPFGFCILEGELVRDPKEYPSLQLIYNLWTKGTSVTSIVLSLSDKGIRSRTGKKWSYKVVQNITKRIDEGELIKKGGRLWLSDKYLKGIRKKEISKKRKPKRKGRN